MKRAFIVATGPSLTPRDCRLIMESDNVSAIYAVNDSYKFLPDADYIYACDCEWWDHHYQATRRVEYRGIERWTTSAEAAKKYGIHHISGQHHDPAGTRFDTSGHGIVYGGNSGFQALNLAFVHGYRRVVLVGFDMGHDEGSPRHFFGEHPREIDKPSPYNHWRDHFKAAAPVIRAAGMSVINASRKTRIECFPRIKLESVL